MSNQNASYLLILDTNIWVAERLLHSSLGSAVLHALASDGASIVLPEVVELEVELVIAKQTEKAADDLRKSADLLRQISGHQKVFHAVPTKRAIEDGIARRWKDLAGVVIRDPFTIEQARSALNRVLNHLSPSTENNEQFRDCCVWASALHFAEFHVVHLVTNDSAFYSSRDRRTIAPSLEEDLKELRCDVKLHSSVSSFLESMSRERIETLEKDVICDAIVACVTPIAHGIAADRAKSRQSEAYDLGEAKRLVIKGYATPQPSLVAIAFDVSFDLQMFDQNGSIEGRVATTLTLDGSCSFDPVKRTASDVIVKSWSHNVKNENGNSWGEMSGSLGITEQIEQTRYV